LIPGKEGLGIFRQSDKPEPLIIGGNKRQICPDAEYPGCWGFKRGVQNPEENPECFKMSPGAKNYFPGIAVFTYIVFKSLPLCIQQMVMNNPNQFRDIMAPVSSPGCIGTTGRCGFHHQGPQGMFTGIFISGKES
jgi:hypothetical protein